MYHLNPHLLRRTDFLHNIKNTQIKMFQGVFHYNQITLALLFVSEISRTIKLNKSPLLSMGEQNGIIKGTRYCIFS